MAFTHSPILTSAFQGGQDPLEVATIGLPPDYFTEKHRIPFLQDFDDLDWYLMAFVILESGRQICLMGRHRNSTYKNGTGIITPAGDPDPMATLHEFLTEFGLAEKHLSWVSDYVAYKPRWQIHRTDDHGNDFVIFNCWDEEHANRIVADFERRGHKQHYWQSKEQPPVIHSPDILTALERQGKSRPATSSDREKFERVLAKVPDVEPEPHDRLSKE